ncbi:MAG: Sua5/YciO/YrdC/YwlC family protein [Burkholderiales bacterium]
MSVLNPTADARRAFDAMRAGGIAVMPMDVGYSLIGATPAALKKIFATKQRAPSKLNAMLGNDAIARDLYQLDARGWEVYSAITHDYDLPLGAVAPYRVGHPMFANLDAPTIHASTKDGTLLMLVNAGCFHAAVTALSHQHQVALFGSSANMTMTGTKFDGVDIEPSIRAIADVVIDYGLMKYHPWRASSTILNLATLEVVRIGSCYENLQSILRRHFKVELPAAPARAA